MNRLNYIKAVAHPQGDRVDLHWLNPKPVEYPGVRVVGRESTHPTTPQDGHLVADLANALLFTLDLSYGHHLDNNIVSPRLSGQFAYHQLIVTTGAGVTVIDPGNQWEISEEDEVYLVYRAGGLLNVYGLARASDTGLPPGKVFYYTLFPYKGQPVEHELNPMNRVTCFATDSMDYGGRMYRQLPVIYHRYDNRPPLPHQADKAGMSEADRKHGQLRRFLDITGSHLDQFHSFASAALHLHDMHRVDGNLLPLLGQWIGWNTLFSTETAGRRNEIRYGPELLQTQGLIPTTETMVRVITGMENQIREMANNVFITNRPEELNFWLAHRDDTGAWTAEEEVFSLDMAFEGRPSAVRGEGGALWLFYHIERNNDWDIWFKNFSEGQGWTPSQPLTGTPTVDTHPRAVLRDKTLMVFWNSFDQEAGTWSIRYRENTGGTWWSIKDFDHGIDAVTGAGVRRKSPCAVVDGNDKVWLFWLETDTAATLPTEPDQWRLKVNRFDGSQWELAQAADVPFDGVSDPRAGADLFAMLRTGGSGADSIVLSWTRGHIEADGTVRCKEVACREKTALTSVSGGWGPVGVMPKLTSLFHYHDREPYTLCAGNGDIELYWSSNRSGAFAVLNTRLTDLSGLSSLDDDDAERVIEGPYSQRHPVPFPSGNEMYLVYRSNQGISYQGATARSKGLDDFRRAGCVAPDHRDRQMNRRVSRFNDCLTYTYDTGENGVPDNNTWYACDTVGIYLTPDSGDVEAVLKKVKTLETLIREFLPLHTRAVFILRPFVTDEPIYTYSLPDADQPYFITEKIDDTVQTEVYPAMKETHTDRALSWSLCTSWSTVSPDGKSVDFSVTPADITSRSWHGALAWQ